MLVYNKHRGDKQLKPFRRTLQGVKGGGTNPVVGGEAQSKGTSFTGGHRGAWRAGAVRQVCR